MKPDQERDSTVPEEEKAEWPKLGEEKIEWPELEEGRNLKKLQKVEVVQR